MNKNLLTASAVLAAATLAVAAPQPPKPQDKFQVQKNQPAKPQQKPKSPKPQPLPPQPQLPKSPKPQIVVMPQSKPVEYIPVCNTYVIQLNADNSIIFEQRLVGLQELRDKIRMVKYDRPRPFIQLKIEDGVKASRLEYALDELQKAGFNDVKIIKFPHRQKFIQRHRIPDKRMKR